MLLMLLACLPSLDPERKGVVDGTGLDTGSATIDEDGDGFPASEDCDDDDSTVHPGAEELCDHVDNDCDGAIDEEGLSVFYEDADGDGHGDANSPTEPTCGAPEGTVASSDDCDDANAQAWPGADELCSTAFDDDCDGQVNEPDAADVPTWYADTDGDGFGDPDTATAQCDAPEGAVDNGDDCDDGQQDVHPGAPEVCNGVDDDCDGVVPADEVDDDGDGFVECTGEDCDDTAANVYVGADEYCNTGVDEDCDGDVDEDDAVDAGSWYADTDGDGQGDASSSVVACDQPSGFVSNDADCLDGDATVYDGAAELCDGQDNDCDGAVAADENDDDADGYVECSVDAGGWDGAAISGGDDCDDGRFATNPGALEYCNGFDDDCDGSTDESDAVDASTWYADVDGDGYGDASSSQTACNQPTGTVTDDTDCDDGDGTQYPNAPEVCGDGVLNDCNASSTDECGPYGSWSLDDAPIAVFGDDGSDYAGYKVHPGDVDEDGDDDLLVLARYADSLGTVAVFYGPVSSDHDISEGDVRVSGVQVDHKSYQWHPITNMLSAGPLTGGDDVLVVASDSYGAVYLFESPTGDLDLNDADIYIDVDADDYGDVGDELASLDVDDDGYEDLVMSAPGFDHEYGDESWQKYWNRGAVWVRYGPITNKSSSFSTNGSGATASRLLGAASYAVAGSALAVGDLTGDGQDDFAVGAPTQGSGTCQVAVVNDLSAGTRSTLAAAGDWLLTGSYYCGSALGVGDQNGDGYDDIAVGDDNGNAVYVFNGPLSGSTTTASADATISGPSGGVLGDAVDLAGDVDDDGYDDLVAGSWSTSNYAGRVYFYTGPLTGSFGTGAAAGTWTGGTSYDYASAGQALAFVGDATGNGYADVLVGATRDDTNATNAGAAWLMEGGPNY